MNRNKNAVKPHPEYWLLVTELLDVAVAYKWHNICVIILVTGPEIESKQNFMQKNAENV